ncbi:translation initiation factor IF3 [Pyrenophora seminiperda CCB06]|uniref:Translation initiation factor IF3 n=1 Tax=Pyrenophora seminiperda CCB06 TaxID=1302712 RepID=A0A3M7M7R6_9PLEO|nr:translation initiation factor IF3 [Pyrenophora seminiperda CCB06]
MPPSHISGTSRALYRVFIAPTLRSATSVPLLYAPAFAPSPSAPTSLAASPSNLTPRTCIRTIKYTKTTRHALSDHYVMDTAIESYYINLVTETGEFHLEVPLDDALASFDRATHHLVEVSPGKVDEFGRPDPAHPPTCKIISKINLRAQHQVKLELMRKQEKGDALKIVEINWAIAQGDMGHRLEKIRKFLKQGKKVEVTLKAEGRKGSNKKATPEEAGAVLRAVRDVVAECKSTSEMKSEGEVGGLMTLVFKGKKVEDKDNKDRKNKHSEPDEREDAADTENKVE